MANFTDQSSATLQDNQLLTQDNQDLLDQNEGQILVQDSSAWDDQVGK